MRKVSVIGTVGLPACYGGWETLVENLVNYKSDDIEYSVYCSSKSYTKKNEYHNGAKLIYIPLSANGKSSILYDIFSMLHSLIKKPDVVLILGVSGCIFLPFFKLLSKSKLVVNVDGIEWKRDKWSGFAKRFLKISEAIAVKYSDVVLSDNQGIQEYLASEYSIKAEVIAYGGDHALTQFSKSELGDYFFSVCRIEPENNIHLILEAFSIGSQKIKIVGNWNASRYGQDLKNKYHKFHNISLIDPIYDINELGKLRSGCKGYIHGHSVGGTNPSLVEIMHFGKNIIAFDCNFNRYTTQNHALYFKNVKDLLSVVEGLDNIENIMMKNIARKEYTWEFISKKYENVFR